MTKVIQLNLHRSIAASSNLINFNFDIALVQEPHIPSLKANNLDLFYKDSKSRTAIVCRKGTNFTVAPEYVTKDSTAGLIHNGNKKIFIASIYLEQPPGSPRYDEAVKYIYLKEWENLLTTCRIKNIPCVIGIDCNAHSPQWGCKDENLRGKILEELIAQYNLQIQNVGDNPTYVRENANSVIDLTLTMGNVDVAKWLVSDAASLSDHKAIQFELHDQMCRTLVEGYNYLKMDWGKFRSVCDNLYSPDEGKVWSTNKIELELEKIYKAIRQALYESSPRRGSRPKPFRIWWDEDCEANKGKTVMLQKRWWKTGNSLIFAEYKAAKFQLKKSIKKAKQKAWRDLVSDADSMKKVSDLHRILTGSRRKSFGLFKKPDGSVCTDQKENLEYLMQAHFKGIATDEIKNSHKQNVVEIESWHSTEIFREAVRKFRPHAAAGPDGIKPIVLQNLSEPIIKTLLDIYEASVKLEYIPIEWRKSNVIFACKGGDRDLNDPRSFRPISLTSFLFKTQERINGWWCEDEGLDEAMHKNQFAFRKGRSTEQAISITVDRIEKGLGDKEFVLLLLLDIRGAFDNIKTESIISAMSRAGIPKEIQQWYAAYLKDRYSTVEQSGTSVTFQITDGTPQGGVLSPPIGWNLAFNDLLKEFDRGPTLSVGFADDDSLTVSGIDPTEIVRTMQHAINKAEKWASECGLTICPKKTVALFFKGGRKYNLPLKNLYLQGKPISYVNSAMYLGVRINNRLNWGEHINERCVKAKKQLAIVNNTLSRIWGPNPRWAKYAYTGIIRPGITYASYIWSSALDNKYVVKKLQSIQRLGLLPISHVRRSTPTKALEILYDVAPLDLHIRKNALKTMCRLQLNVGLHKGHRKHLRGLIPHGLRDRKLDRIGSVNLARPSPFTKSIGTGEDDKMEDHFRCYTDGSLIEGRAGAGGIILEKKDKNYAELASFCQRYIDATVYQSELLGIKMAAEILRSLGTEGKTISFCIDNQAAIKALCGSSTNSRAVWETWSVLNSLIGHNNLINLTWVKAHVGTMYNEYADKAAKTATSRDRGIEAPLSLASVNRILIDDVNQAWDRDWQAYKEARQTKVFVKGTDPTRAKILLSLPKQQLGQVIRFLTGHVFMKRHNKILLHGSRNIPTEDISCSLCGLDEETPLHLFMQCPCLTSARAEATGRYLIDDDEYSHYSVKSLLRIILDPKVRSLEDANALDT